MPDPPPTLRIPIRPDWDTTSTYHSLDDEPDESRIFVGRDSLIAPLVAEIAEPNKGGTYLISGYRGTGKTTLLIEALTQAKRQLALNDHSIFPVVLNVSEISASLGSTAESTPVQLIIDPRRLLIALIRQMREGIVRLSAKTPPVEAPKSRRERLNARIKQMRERISRRPRKPSGIEELTNTVNYTYEKATASKFSASTTASQENTRSRLRELALTTDDKNVLKTLGIVAGAGAVAFEGAAWIPQLSWLHAAALWLGGISAVGLVASYKRAQSEKSSNVRQTAFEFDNSLQQLETDLKDILAALQKNGFRTVVVMEELDKIDDRKGEQLAAVISYFKNLFTQAPALFFFVTDKSYFDIVASAIKRARRERSYAIQHTFFTHRIFVGRPTTEECLQFIAALAANKTDQEAIQAVAKTLGKPSRTSEADRLGLFIRLVLFFAANHMFDLKNELRQFARNETYEFRDAGKIVRKSYFLVDEQTLPVEQEALAVFQDLIVEKSRAFEIKGGRAYANETLADSLYAVFNELGSTQPQKIDSFLPISNPQSENALLLDEQLDLSEAARVRQAVYSLIADLERGGAIQSRDPAANTFTWRDNAAREFHYIRQLQQHEDELIAELQRIGTLANALLADSDPPASHPLAVELENRVAELRKAPEAMTADDAKTEQREKLELYRDAFSKSVDARISELEKYGFNFERFTQGLGGRLYFVKPTSGDPRLSTSESRGAVLLAFGETDTLEEDVWSFIAPTATSLSGLNRVALVHVIHAAGNVMAERESRRKRWNETMAKRAAAFPELRYALNVIPLVQAKAVTPRFNAVEDTAALLAELGLWARPESRFYESLPRDTPPLTEALRDWSGSDSLVFHINGTPLGSARPFGERDDLETDGTAVLGLVHVSKASNIFADIAITCMLKGFGQAFGGPEQWRPLGEWMLQNHRIILYVDWESMFSWTAEDIVEALKAGVQVIVTKSESLPVEFEDFGIVEAPAPEQSLDPIVSPGQH